MDPNTVELKLYDSQEDKRYRSWKIPMPVAEAISYWRQNMGDQRTLMKSKRLGNVVISMPSSGFVDVKELDVLGHPKLAGWSLPVVVVEALAKKLVIKKQEKGIGESS